MYRGFDQDLRRSDLLDNWSRTVIRGGVHGMLQTTLCISTTSKTTVTSHGASDIWKVACLLSTLSFVLFLAWLANFYAHGNPMSLPSCNDSITMASETTLTSISTTNSSISTPTPTITLFNVGPITEFRGSIVGITSCLTTVELGCAPTPTLTGLFTCLDQIRVREPNPPTIISPLNKAPR